MTAHPKELDRLYEILSPLATNPSFCRQLGACSGRSSWPPRGVYFFTEPGERRARDGHVSRIVRVGTHAISAAAKSTLWGRLRAHRGGRDKGGNHRGSIFRLHVGAALLAAERSALPTWGVGASAPCDIRQAEVAHEKRVSEYIGAMSVMWIDVPDDPSALSDRAFIERNAIALLSNGLAPLDPASDTWLGRSNPRQEIAWSGLWNLNHVEEEFDRSFCGLLERYVETTVASCR